MPRLEEKRLDQMIENALSYEQEKIVTQSWRKWFYAQLASGVVAAAIILALLVLAPETPQPQSTDYVADLYEMMAVEIMDDLTT